MTNAIRSIDTTMLSLAKLTGAWAIAVAILAGTTTVAFVAVENWARPLFVVERQRLQSETAGVEMGAALGSVELTTGTMVEQRFDAVSNGLTGLRLLTVTWNQTPDDYTCEWSLLEHSSDGRSKREIRKGAFSTASVRDWGTIELAFEPVPDSFSAHYTLQIRSAEDRPSRPAGLPLFAPQIGRDKGVWAGRRLPIQITTKSQETTPAIPKSATLDLQPVYAKDRG